MVTDKLPFSLAESPYIYESYFYVYSFLLFVFLAILAINFPLCQLFHIGTEETREPRENPRLSAS